MYICLSVCLCVSLCIQCDANSEVSKVAVAENKYENVLTLITYYQMVRPPECVRGCEVWCVECACAVEGEGKGGVIE